MDSNARSTRAWNKSRFHERRRRSCRRRRRHRRVRRSRRVLIQPYPRVFCAATGKIEERKIYHVLYFQTRKQQNARVRKTNTIATTVKKDVQSVAPRRWWRRSRSRSRSRASSARFESSLEDLLGDIRFEFPLQLTSYGPGASKNNLLGGDTSPEEPDWRQEQRKREREITDACLKRFGSTRS